MPIKIDIHTNINDHDLTSETCSEIINMLQNSYQSIRKDMYQHFLNYKHLNKSLIVVGILFLMSILFDSFTFIYLMPISVIVSMAISLISAEYLTNQSRKIIKQQLKHYKEKQASLMKKENLQA